MARKKKSKDAPKKMSGVEIEGKLMVVNKQKTQPKRKKKPTSKSQRRENREFRKLALNFDRTVQLGRNQEYTDFDKEMQSLVQRELATTTAKKKKPSSKTKTRRQRQQKQQLRKLKFQPASFQPNSKKSFSEMVDEAITGIKTIPGGAAVPLRIAPPRPQETTTAAAASTNPFAQLETETRQFTFQPASFSVANNTLPTAADIDPDL